MRLIPFILALLLGVAALAGSSAIAHDEDSFEVWAIDQSDTTADGGGTLYVYDGRRLSGRRAEQASPRVVDLGGAARSLCLAQTGTAPRRPHMLMFNEEHTHAVLGFVATGHVLFLDEGAGPIACIDVGASAHAAMPAHSGNYVVVANLAGKQLHRIATDYETNTFTLEPAATVNLATCVTPNGFPCEGLALRPDNAPICPIIDEASKLTFVTLRGGGMFVFDATATPMAIVAEYDKDAVHPSGCGGAETRGKMYVNAGGGWPANPLEADLYAFRLSAFSTTTPGPPNTPAPRLVFSHDDRGFVDSHGAAMPKHGRYLWVDDRAANRIVVVDTRRDLVVNEINLVGVVSTDPAPDLMDVSPRGNRVFVSLRGPNPLTGNVVGVNNAVGNSPGVGVLRVRHGGHAGELYARAPITHVVDGVERADPHALTVRVPGGHDYEDRKSVV